MQRLAALFSRISRRAALAAACVLLLGVAAWSIASRVISPGYLEAAELNAAPLDAQGYQTYFQQLADAKGAPYAFEILRRTMLPQMVDVHLTAHVIGDMLYKEQGIDGIKICTDEFRNACSHSIVIGVLNDEGPSALPKIADTCKEAPGGTGAYTMCFHGLGHGVLAYNDYDLGKAVEMCKLTGTKEYHYQEYVQCVGGTIMEIIAGVHDRAAWEKQSGNYLTERDPLSPCNTGTIPEEAKGMCYMYLTPHLFEAVGIDLGSPDPAFFPDAMALCGALPENDPNREVCFSGFGKEYIGIAAGKGTQDSGTASHDMLRTMHEWCAGSSDERGAIACDLSVLGSLFWGGENTPDASFTYCGLLEGEPQQACYASLTDQIRFYFPYDSAKKNALCARLPEPFRTRCADSRPRP